ncbi:hypothetical protein HER39_17650 [Arthrobacter deserti]|uniref:Uncharacterized protein n=1 Tax=Arthrobacter deserti TaxID=1742687 RepID=A0ABX1JST4_9MICC|nr:hypothetical protein [Arthrobacter deserti]
MSTEQTPDITGGGTGAERAADAVVNQESEADLAHGGDEAKAEELEKKAYGGQDDDGDDEAPYVQFPG